ncbi:YkgJ family cysteine cluster protein [Magnetospirillum sp. UT-4]|uniref:YkgJ family cysteine cluster protein n=1 Tax=Magnetospirillum sp. UT-4 TaxID=2681467 RepID=UPI00137E1696|nr:YkgJ family cysteine cluster protein [Magnetospirillum sp. UT-4]CAA7627206.1 conserved hypothetical protein [Magnetospirillum sp. UT-4]
MPPTYSEVEAKARAAAAAHLPAHPAQAARAAIALAESVLAECAAGPLKDRLAELQCGPGCTPCCHQAVGVTLAELALVADSVAALPGPVQAGVRQRSAALRRVATGLDVAGWWRARLACPLLDGDGTCLVHAARPLPCRAMNSADAGICRRSFAGEADQIPVLAAQHGIMGRAQAGLAQALAAAGLDHRPVALGTGLG